MACKTVLAPSLLALVLLILIWHFHAPSGTAPAPSPIFGPGPLPRLHPAPAPMAALPPASGNHQQQPAAGKTLAQLLAELDALDFSADPAQLDHAVENLLPGLIRRSPAEVAAWIITKPGRLWQDLLKQASSGWAAQDLPALTAWGANLADPGDQFVALSEGVTTPARTDPAAAITMIEQYDLSACNNNLVSSAGSNDNSLTGFRAATIPGPSAAMLILIGGMARLFRRRR